MNHIHPMLAWQQAVAQAFNEAAEASFQSNVPTWRDLPLDIADGDEALTITAALPGLSAEDVEIAIHDGVLAIKTKTETETDEDSKYYMRERCTCSFQRAVRLPVEVDEDKAEARFDNGILTLTLPKVEAAQPKRIAISAG
jgi:HSP20 family protein